MAPSMVGPVVSQQSRCWMEQEFSSSTMKLPSCALQIFKAIFEILPPMCSYSTVIKLLCNTQLCSVGKASQLSMCTYQDQIAMPCSIYPVHVQSPTVQPYIIISLISGRQKREWWKNTMQLACRINSTPQFGLTFAAVLVLQTAENQRSHHPSNNWRRTRKQNTDARACLDSVQCLTVHNLKPNLVCPTISNHQLYQNKHGKIPRSMDSGTYTMSSLSIPMDCRTSVGLL